jgi:hypothetical protein
VLPGARSHTLPGATNNRPDCGANANIFSVEFAVANVQAEISTLVKSGIHTSSNATADRSRSDLNTGSRSKPNSCVGRCHTSARCAGLDELTGDECARTSTGGYGNPSKSCSESNVSLHCYCCKLSRCPKHCSNRGSHTPRAFSIRVYYIHRVIKGVSVAIEEAMVTARSFISEPDRVRRQEPCRHWVIIPRLRVGEARRRISDMPREPGLVAVGARVFQHLSERRVAFPPDDGA